MKVPFYKHDLEAGHAALIGKVLDSPILTSGQVGRAVEAQLAAYFSIPHALLVNSWTNGAVACLLAMDIGPGDEVIVPAMTFVATANVVELLGAKPVFADVDPRTLLLTPETVLPHVTSRTRAIIPVHLYGLMVDIPALKAALPAGIRIIEDCAHCFEGERAGLKPGAQSDAAIFSFYATKNVTCGEGGAIVTRDPELAKRITATRLHGMSAGAIDRFRNARYNHWDVERLGVKANQPDLLSALLPPQIETIDARLPVRERIATRYHEGLRHLNGLWMQESVQGARHARHLFTVAVDGASRDEMIGRLNAAGIGCTVNYRSVPHLTYYRKKYGYQRGQFPVSERWGDGTMSLPLFPSIDAQSQDYVIATFEREWRSLAEGGNKI
jgi:UDP-4-amino-4-deoxy-L-arabinose-oxoglutarate aminotransferase